MLSDPVFPSTWWRTERARLLEIAEAHPAAYVYHLPTIRSRARRLTALAGLDRVFYAVKANAHPELLKVIGGSGIGFECVSPGELDRVFEATPGLDPGHVLFTPNFAPREEYRAALDRGVHLTLDALHPLEAWGDLLRGREVLVRIDPGWGLGHHEMVRTGGEWSKFGVPLFEVDRLRRLADTHQVRVVGLHVHAGSGIVDRAHWDRVLDVLLPLADGFRELRVLNLGGGLGVPDRPGTPELPLGALSAPLDRVRGERPALEVWMEPGRWLVAQAGVLLARVTQVKGKGAMRYIGVTTGMNSLVRPALYDAWHTITNLSRPDAPLLGPAQIVGPICESGDRLGSDREMPETREGDVLLIETVGAYGRSMASSYNLREPAAEVVLDG